MTIGTTDIYLLVIIVSTLVVGFFWGAVRSILLLAAWLLAFLTGAYLKIELGSYLAGQWESYPPAFSEMAAFGVIYLGMLLAAPIVIFVVTRGSQRISRYQVIDDLTGSLLAVLVALLGIAGLLIVLSTFYQVNDGLVSPQGGPDWTANLYQSLLNSNIGSSDWTANLYQSLLNSNIGSSIERYLVPLIDTILGPILPSDVREAVA